MILRLKANAYEQELMSLLDLAATLVTYLAAYQGKVLDETTFVAEVPCGEWLLRHLRAHINELLGHTTRQDRKLLAKAVRNDRQFDKNIDSRSFSLQYPALPEHIRRHSKALFTALYDSLLGQGFKITRDDGRTLVVDRRLLERGFFEANQGLRACPACLEGEIFPAGNGAPTTIDCDHFLPKFIYGPLAIHPQNLVFICMPCNQRRKGRRDPLTSPGAADVQTRQRTEAGSLRRSYLPYRRCARSEMRIEFARAKVTLTADTDVACERVASLDRVFGLAQVWSEVLPRAEREMFEELKGPPTRESVKAVLDDTEGRGQGVPEQLSKESSFVVGTRRTCGRIISMSSRGSGVANLRNFTTRPRCTLADRPCGSTRRAPGQESVSGCIYPGGLRSGCPWRSTRMSSIIRVWLLNAREHIGAEHSVHLQS